MYGVQKVTQNANRLIPEVRKVKRGRPEIQCNKEWRKI
jgi:hypothetical protein